MDFVIYDGYNTILHLAVFDRSINDINKIIEYYGSSCVLNMLQIINDQGISPIDYAIMENLRDTGAMLCDFLIHQRSIPINISF